ncbi:bifunctional 5,10-methylenetetrahydrofolate dehydrogenase/5,10-methenyltetrahydrofolate cyclohydrolase [Streptomyces sp. NPDC049099]|uniref:bifunctional 5,10-methylenetetrahydrofolate dehydrogenase/5,10-methenyltetrahydrofolate cyclohydrolase n=1 Tax=Streptomyces sp. NPDC049099 TaxID=3155768 RepID=UPI003421B324
MSQPPTRRLSGTTLLRSVGENLAPYRRVIEPAGQQVAIIRFAAAAGDPPLWHLRMEAARVSAEQKVKAFSRLGFGVDHRLLTPPVAPSEFADLLDAFNKDRKTAAVIVQFPPPPHLTPLVQRLDPAKDIDALLEDRSRYPACATADGIARLVTPFATDNPTVAVVGARGFVGRGVVRLLSNRGLQVRELDTGDDLRAVHEADIVVSATGQPHILTPDHIRPHHRLVVDSGFMPRPDGSVAGDVRPDAATVPQYVTPVPGGVGPVEMAVLMDRIVRQEADAGLKPWQLPQVPYLTRHQVDTGPAPAVQRPTLPTPTPGHRLPDQWRVAPPPSPGRKPGGLSR